MQTSFCGRGHRLLLLVCLMNTPEFLSVERVAETEAKAKSGCEIRNANGVCAGISAMIDDMTDIMIDVVIDIVIDAKEGMQEICGVKRNVDAEDFLKKSRHR